MLTAYGWSVFSRVFPGPQMPWNENSTLRLQDMYDQVYSHLIRTSKHRETILQILGQCLFSEGIDPDVNLIGASESTLSCKRIEILLGLGCGTIPQILADISLLLEIGDEDQDIKICDPLFRSFLLDRSRSQELFRDSEDAQLTLKFAAPIRKVFGDQGM